MKKTSKETCGTSWHGVAFEATPNQLLDILGEPAWFDNTGRDKVNFDWKMETYGGKVFTVYDWKEYRPLLPDEVISWHIGGFCEEDTKAAHKEVLNALVLNAVSQIQS